MSDNTLENLVAENFFHLLNFTEGDGQEDDPLIVVKFLCDHARLDYTKLDIYWEDVEKKKRLLLGFVLVVIIRFVELDAEWSLFPNESYVILKGTLTTEFMAKKPVEITRPAKIP